MATWATIEDLRARRGQDLTLILGSEDIVSDTVSEVRLETSLNDAQSTMESYIVVKYPDLNELRSLSPIPSILTRYTVEIAVYLLAYDECRLTKEIRERYDDCIEWLKMVRSGDVRIPTSPELSTGLTGAEIISDPPLFTRDSQRGMW